MKRFLLLLISFMIYAPPAKEKSSASSKFIEDFMKGFTLSDEARNKLLKMFSEEPKNEGSKPKIPKIIIRCAPVGFYYDAYGNIKKELLLTVSDGTKSLLQCSVEPDHLPKVLKYDIHRKTGIPMNDQQLLIGDKEWNDHESVGSRFSELEKVGNEVVLKIITSKK